MYQKVDPLTGDHLEHFKESLLTEDLAEDDTLLSVHNSPVEGALRHAHEYFDETFTGSASDTIVNSDGETITLNETGLALDDIYPDAEQCIDSTSVILIVDAAPTSYPTDLRHVDSCLDANNTTCSADAAADLLAEENIKTYVVLFADDDDKADLDLIAAGGGTGSAYFAADGAGLSTALNSIIGAINPHAGSSSGISVVASSSDTAGSVAQAIYSPAITGLEADGITETTVSWSSTLSTFFLDKYGYLREDNPSTGTQGKLDESYDIDGAFTLSLEDVDTDGDFIDDDQEVRATRIKPINFGTDSFTETVLATGIELDDLNPIWEASKLLGEHYTGAATDAQIDAVGAIYGEINRDYDSVASDNNGYRRIYSWIQSNPSNSVFDSGDQIEFIYDDCDPSCTVDGITPSNHTLLGVDISDPVLAKSQAQNIVQFTRGRENITGLRTRSIADKAYLLGSIVHSTAAQVDIPNNVFNTRFADSSYSAFKEYYENRRRMLYIGANDGLLHAFNGGFWNGETAELSLVAPDGSDNVAHALGAEIWAYAPMNLLPHLQWLTSTGYDSSVHVAYMDGPVKIFDVRAFDEDSVHVNGWGTILVAGMRFGGGEYEDVDHDADGDAADTFTARSAYVVIDITDPRQEPVVIGEVTHEHLGFTTSEPTIMKEGDDWYLMFGSGPNEITTATNVPTGAAVNRRPHIYRYKLNEGERGFASDGDGDDTIGTSDGFVGDMIAQDWNSDYSHDAVYFGIITGDEADTSGGLYRYVGAHETTSGNSKVTALLDVGQPVVHKPLLKRLAGKNWALFGTGRFFTVNDGQNDDQNSFYGVMEPRTATDYGSVSTAATSILDVTNIDVAGPTTDTDGDLVGGGTLSVSVDGQTTFNELRSHILSDTDVNGWKFDFPSAVNAPTAKSSASPLSFKSLLFYTYYEPVILDGTECTNEFGDSTLNVVDLVTGTASFTKAFAGPLGLDAGGNIEKSSYLGEGYAYQSYLFVGPDPETGNSRILIKSPLSTGEISDTAVMIPPSPNGRTSWREIEVQ